MRICTTASVQKPPTATKPESCSKKNYTGEKKSTSSFWPRLAPKWPASSGAVYTAGGDPLRLLSVPGCGFYDDHGTEHNHETANESPDEDETQALTM